MQRLIGLVLLAMSLAALPGASALAQSIPSSEAPALPAEAQEAAG